MPAYKLDTRALGLIHWIFDTKMNSGLIGLIEMGQINCRTC